MNAKRAAETPYAAVADAAPNELTLALAHHLTAIKDQRQLSQREFAALTGLTQASATERQGSGEERTRYAGLVQRGRS